MHLYNGGPNDWCLAYIGKTGNLDTNHYERHYMNFKYDKRCEWLPSKIKLLMLVNQEFRQYLRQNAKLAKDQH